MNPPYKSTVKAISLILVCLSFAFISQEARANTYNVADGDVAGLIAAINSANSNPGPDTINLAPGGTYTLTYIAGPDSWHGPTGLPIVQGLSETQRESLTINGNGSTIQRSDAPGVPEFRIFHALYANVILDSVVIKGGRGSGSRCGGGGLYLNVSNTLIRNSTITGNFGVEGGGICNNNASTLTIENSTISGNTGSGGEIKNLAASLSISTTTIYDDQADSNRSDSIVDQFSAPGSIVIKNSIVATRTGGTGINCYAFIPVSLGHNIFSDSTCGQNVAGGDLIIPTLTLGALGNNGGPTPTHALLIGSPAIDDIPQSDCTNIAGLPVVTDQRGDARPIGTRCDIGAFETTNCSSGLQTVSVPGTANPWLAGMPNGTILGLDSAPGQSPVLVSNVAGVSELLFTVFGATDNCSSCQNSPNSDGGPSIFTHNVGTANGIGQILAPANALIGVFLDDNTPDSTAAPTEVLDFSTPASRDYLTLSPQLKQPFFIGDGRASGGTQQRITVPAGATRLFLGSMDGAEWNNNAGAFDVTVMSACPTPPTPGECSFPGAVSHWAGEGNANDVVDSNHGIVRGNATFAAGVDGQSFNLNGGYVEVPDSASLSITGPMTMAAWIKINGNNFQQAIIEKYDTPGRNGYLFRILSNGRLNATVCNPSTCSNPAAGASTVTTGTWHHVAAVYDGVTMRIYLDGNIDGSMPMSFAPTDGAASLRIGARGDDANTRLVGSIDMPRIFNRALSSSEIQTMASCNSEPTPTPTPTPTPSECSLEGTVSHWPAEGNGLDIQGGNHGLVWNSAGFAPGIEGQAFSLSGGYIEVPDSPSLSITGPMTMEAWIKINSNGFQQAIIEKYDVPGRNGYLLRVLAGGKLQSSMCNPATCAAVVGSTPVSPGDWHHVAAVYDGTTIRIYLDGNVDATGPTVTPTDGPMSLKIGARGDDANTRLLGLIDEARIFNRALTADEIQRIAARSCGADTTAPVVSCPAPVELSADAEDCQVPVPDVISAVTATDDSGSVTLSQSPAAGTLVGLGITTITVTATDAANNSSSCSVELTVVDNTPPIIEPLPNITTTTDPGSCTATVNFAPAVSDGCGEVSFSCSSPSGSAFPIGTTGVTCTAIDASGNTASTSFTVTVDNPAPTVSINSPASGAIFAVGTNANFAGSFTDNNGDLHTAQWSFVSSDQNLTQPGVINEGTATVNADYTFTTPGVYLVTLTIADQCGNSATTNVVSPEGLSAMVVVYDPNGGSVTGGGWFDSPAGAFAANPSLIGRANFGFTSRYHNGANVPDGQTEFQFKAGNLNFHSSSYEWLVVAGAKAQFKGSGTINGSGAYDFMLTVIDGHISGGGGADKFRIRIWDRNNGGLLYDNMVGGEVNDDPTTVIRGGSIVIHK